MPRSGCRWGRGRGDPTGCGLLPAASDAPAISAVHDGSGAEDQRLIPPRTPVADTAAPDRAAFAIGTAAARVIRFPATGVRTAPLSGDALPAG